MTPLKSSYRSVEEILGNFEEKKINEVIKRFDQDYREGVEVYFFLQDYYKSGDSDDPLFQFVYRSFYGLNRAGLSTEQKKRYFELMKERVDDLRRILEELYKIPDLRKRNKYQFSFATKLIHTVNNKNPIWDSNVSEATGIGRPGKNEGLKAYTNRYEQLEDLYRNLLKKRKCLRAIKKFKEKYYAKCIPDQKALDFLLWGIGKSKR